jgi:predicted RNA binding protein YcfA (HicA-like mRNA interferase family)
MSDLEKLLAKARSGPRNLNFREFLRLLEGFGFTPQRRKGTSHITFKHSAIPELFTVQPDKHGKAEAWQVKRLLGWIEFYVLRAVNPPNIR